MKTSTTTLALATTCLLAGTVTAATPAYEDLTLHDSYAVMDTANSDSVSMIFRPFFWSNGTPYSGGYGQVIDGGFACQSDNELLLNNISCVYDFASSIGTQSYARFAFGEYGGNINLAVNGDLRNVGNFRDLDGLVIGGATFKVAAGGYGNDCGVAELHGPIGQLLIGGQELVVDNVTSTEGEPCQYGYEDLLTGDTYNYPDTFVTDGILCRQLGFQWGSSTWFFNGTTTVDNRAYACASGNELWLNNSMIAHDFAGSIGSMENVSIQFGEYGGNINIDINGDFRNVANFIDLDGLTIGGVTVHVPYGGHGNDCGKLELTGRVDVLAIGGQECWIDCLEGDVTSTPNGDTNNDGSVNVQDLLELLNQWGQCSGSCSADFNGDQMVDVTDLLTMLANWG